MQSEKTEIFTKTPGWLDWYSGPAKPTFKLPAGAVDAHCHVFGPAPNFPMRPSANTRRVMRPKRSCSPCATTWVLTKT